MSSSDPALSAKRRSLLWTLPAVLLSPRRAGRSLVHRGLPSALAVHVLALLVAAVAFAAVLGFLAQRVSDDTNSMVVGAARGVAARSTWRFGAMPAGSATLFLAAVTAAVGEAFYWAAGITILSAWTAAGLTLRGASHRGAVLAGFASLYLIPLAAAWAAMIGTGMAQLDTGRGSAGSEMLLWWVIVLSVGPLPALAVAMALRMAGGLGEVLPGESPDPDKRCEWCGYNLHAIGFDSHCPECGRDARDSLSPIHRCHGWEVGQRGYLATLRDILARPAGVFYGIAMRHRLAPARRFLLDSTLLSTAIIVLTCGAAGVCQIGPIGPGLLMTPGIWWPRFAAGLVRGLWLGSWWAVMIPAMAMMTATALHGACRRREENIRLRGAVKLGCYLSALAVPSAAIGGGALCL
ncbi:MAG: hypothetical protein GX591_17980, partial [Planctomycetes bacterium]|nr:hypothetical protein [Planctomycetota bacterium]